MSWWAVWFWALALKGSGLGARSGRIAMQQMNRGEFSGVGVAVKVGRLLQTGVAHEGCPIGKRDLKRAYPAKSRRKRVRSVYNYLWDYMANPCTSTSTVSLSCLIIASRHTPCYHEPTTTIPCRDARHSIRLKVVPALAKYSSLKMEDRRVLRLCLGLCYHSLLHVQIGL